jgi:hypothetical protein
MEYVQRIPPHTRQVWGKLLLIVGLLLGLAFNASATLGNLEANAYWGGEEGASYTHFDQVDARISSLRCPMLMTSRDSQQVTVAITNQISRPVTSPIQAYVSDITRAQQRGDLRRVPIAAGQTQQIAWTVNPEDAGSAPLILVRIFLYNFYPVPSRTATCGILFLRTSMLSGNLLTAFVIGVILACLVVGTVLWRSTIPALRDQRLLAANGLALMAGAIVVMMVANLFSYWLVAAIIFLITIFLGVILLANYFQPSL